MIRVNVPLLLKRNQSQLSIKNVTCFTQRFQKRLNMPDRTNNVQMLKETKQQLDVTNDQSGIFQVLVDTSGLYYVQCKVEAQLLSEQTINILPRRMARLREENIHYREIIDKVKSKHI